MHFVLTIQDCSVKLAVQLRTSFNSYVIGVQLLLLITNTCSNMASLLYKSLLSAFRPSSCALDWERLEMIDSRCSCM